jgi:hypothetical protein
LASPRSAPIRLPVPAQEPDSSRRRGTDPDRKGNLVALEVRIVRVHVEESLLLAGHEHRIDPDAWRPLIMSFCQFYGLDERVYPSRLAEIPESAYRPRSRAA